MGKCDLGKYGEKAFDVKTSRYKVMSATKGAVLFLHSTLNTPGEMGHASPENDPGAIFVLIIGINEVGPFFLHYAKPTHSIVCQYGGTAHPPGSRQRRENSRELFREPRRPTRQHRATRE
jgi:hypothetical protein